MSSRKGVGKPSIAGPANLSSRGKNKFEVSSTVVDQLSHGVADASLGSGEDDEWEVYARKPKNRAGSSAAKPWVSQNPNASAWGHSDVIQKPGMRGNGGSGKNPGNSWATQTADSRKRPGRGNGKPQSFNKGLNSYLAQPSVIPPPLEGGWKWPTRAGATQPKGSSKDEISVEPGDDEDDVDDDFEALDDTDDDFFSDEYDSDSSQKSHETRKKGKYFKAFFEILDKLTMEEVSDSERQWHCPACQGIPGAIDWYRGLQPLISHANTKGSKRVRVHRELAKLLNEEMHRRGTLVTSAGEAFGKWKGLYETVKDHDIVWPPMVVIMNTLLEKDENDKWIGMGNQELLDYFSSYTAVRARHSYGPHGHRGMSVLIFEVSAMGYLEAERLHKHFQEQGTDRDAWHRRRGVPFYPGGKRQLFGYMAVKEDMDIFNQHSQGKSRLKFDMRSYQETVVSQIRQMSEDNQKLIWFKDKIAKEQRHSKALEESFGIVSAKLRKTMEETRIVRQRTKMQHQQNKDEMDSQEQFFKEEIQKIHNAREVKEDEFEKLQQEEREKVKQANASSSSVEDDRYRSDEVSKFIQLQDKEMEKFVEEREMLIKTHGDKKTAMKQRHWEEAVMLETEFNVELAKLMEKYAPNHLAENSSSL